ncbi:glycosyltransferase [Lysobacter sp. GX 14042]|uniref:glycosyltransferase family 2 protein n=1 Tax=Lysobacter sp. GX 14042 TaxID=2907155 RepID=UPI001F1DE326|nr:glycosyltransferase family 2 protein [Lysobacter sp. GX 14042]MCE7032786.1 glycosyltransferase [Lysobacter sp. GX 14042]
MNAPKISVIVPLYKTELYVEKCLRSIMAQSFPDIEIICVDDRSPDASAEVAMRLAAEDQRIRLIRHEENLGLGGARNTGIREARAEYIASVDSDDFVESGFLEDLWIGSDAGHYDVVVAGYSIVSPSGKCLKRHAGKNKILDPIPENQNPIRISDPAFWNKLWRRSLFVDNEIWFPNHIYHQDSATTPRIYTKARRVKFIKSWKYNYLLRADSITQSTSDKHLLDRYRCVDVLKDFFIREGLYEKLEGAITDRILSGYSYHVGNVVKNRHGGEEKTNDYLRHLLIMREAYLEHDMVVRGMSLEEKADLLLNHKPIPRGAGGGQPEWQASKRKAPSERPALPRDPRVLVLTLYAGEHEFEQSRTSLSAQTHQNWQQVVIRGMGNLEAHHALYKTIMQRREDFDLFIKLDADMTFARAECMEEIIDIFRERRTLDHLVLACDDYMTGTQIIGVHTFSNRVRWESSGSGIFNDPDPLRPGTRKMYGQPKMTYFRHASDPSSLQAFHFGAHRALKLVQRGFTFEQKRVEAMHTQWEALIGLWQQYCRYRDRRHALALVAADLVIGGALGEHAHDYQDHELHAAFDRFSAEPGARLWERVGKHWESDDARQEYFQRAVGATGLQKLAAAA